MAGIGGSSCGESSNEISCCLPDRRGHASSGVFACRRGGHPAKRRTFSPAIHPANRHARTIETGSTVHDPVVRRQQRRANLRRSSAPRCAAHSQRGERLRTAKRYPPPPIDQVSRASAGATGGARKRTRVCPGAHSRAPATA